MIDVDLGAAFVRHRGVLAAAAARVLHRGDEVDDVLQDTFVEALRGVHNLREPAAARAVDPRASALDLALLAAVGEVVSSIPAERRRAWALRTVDGEPIDDIAACCGCSVTTVKRRIAEVRGLLEAALG